MGRMQAGVTVGMTGPSWTLTGTSTCLMPLCPVQMTAGTMMMITIMAMVGTVGLAGAHPAHQYHQRIHSCRAWAIGRGILGGLGSWAAYGAAGQVLGRP